MKSRIHDILRRRPDGSRGAAAIVTAVAMVGLLGAGAIVLDVGALYQERRELQNGADAAAFSLAKDCATGSCSSGQGNPVSKAEDYADLNADDGNSVVELVCGNGSGISACPVPPSGITNATGYVVVKTATGAPNAGGTTPSTVAGSYATPSQINYTFGQALKSNSKTGSIVRAQAAAAWGPPASGSTIPLTISVCEHMWAVGSPATYPSAERILYFHGSNNPTGDCDWGPAGHDIPGGFGWLENSGCTATINVGNWIDDDTGNNVPSGCNPVDWQGKTLLLPIYDQVTGNGNNGEYHIVGFAALELTGYKFNGNNKWPNTMNCPLQPGNSGVCLRGRFTKFLSTGSNSFGTNDFGASVFRMIG